MITTIGIWVIKGLLGIAALLLFIHILELFKRHVLMPVVLFLYPPTVASIQFILMVILRIITIPVELVGHGLGVLGANRVKSAGYFFLAGLYIGGGYMALVAVTAFLDRTFGWQLNAIPSIILTWYMIFTVVIVICEVIYLIIRNEWESRYFWKNDWVEEVAGGHLFSGK